MQAVMLSIRPEWCEKIASRHKTVEVRKRKPMLRTPFKCYIYETQGKTETPWMDEEGHMIWKGRGMVIGEFVCDYIFSVPVRADGFLPTWNGTALRHSMLSPQEISDYIGKGKGSPPVS